MARKVAKILVAWKDAKLGRSLGYRLTGIMKLQYLDVCMLRIGESGFLTYLLDDIFLKSSKDFIK